MSETYSYRDRKTVIVLSSAITPAISLNVVGHLCIAIGHRMAVETMGKSPLVDKSGIPHLGISKYPVIITKVKTSTVRKALVQARSLSGLLVADYPKQMLDTGHDSELEVAIASTLEDSIEYFGVAIHGPTPVVDSITGKYTLWRDPVETTSPSAAPQAQQ
jgi:hypothetical protein